MTPDDARAPCPGCGEALWRKRAGAWSLVCKILRLTDAGDFVAKCPRCGNDAPVTFLGLVDRAPPRRIRPVVRTSTP